VIDFNSSGHGIIYLQYDIKISALSLIDFTYFTRTISHGILCTYTSSIGSMNIINWSLIQRRLVRLEKQNRFFPVVAKCNLRGAIKEVSPRRDAEYTSDPSTSAKSYHLNLLRFDRSANLLINALISDPIIRWLHCRHRCHAASWKKVYGHL